MIYCRGKEKKGQWLSPLPALLADPLSVAYKMVWHLLQIYSFVLLKKICERDNNFPYF